MVVELMSIITINCSLGEVIDKITILDIKCDEIKDQAKLLDCKGERDMLLSNIRHVYDPVLHFNRQVLRYINKQIWDDQEVVRSIEDDAEYGRICKKVIEDNDSRFRVKRIINAHFNSQLKEQKSYQGKTCLVVSHMGLGDCINIAAAVRYYSTKYEQVAVIAKSHIANNIRLLYQDNPFIQVLVIDSNQDETRQVKEIAQMYYQLGADVKLSGFFYTHTTYKTEHVPIGFYTDFGLDFEQVFMSKDWFFCKDTLEDELKQQLKQLNIVLVHKNASTQCVDVIAENVKHHLHSSNTLVIDTSVNAYTEDHPHFELACKLVMMPISSYVWIIENANEIHAVDSWLYCMSINLHSKATKKVVYARSMMPVIEKLDPTFECVDLEA